MIKKLFALVLVAVLLQGCQTYKRFFGETFTKINTSKHKKIYRLDLSNQNLKKTPILFNKLVELRMLNISNNKSLNLDEMFETIPNPEQLEILILDSLNLKKIPKSILRFTNLKNLSLNYNPALNLEETITTISSLPIEFLNLQQNNLKTIPAKIVNITTLTGINLSYNKISNPLIFRHLSKLEKLNSLWLTKNNLYNLHEEIGLLLQIRNLYIEHNQLSSLPNSITNLEKLDVLHLGHNSFTSLPLQIIKMPRLILLHINNCKITEISEQFATSKYSLKSMLFDNNKLSEKDKKRWQKEFDSFIMASFE